MKKTTFYFLLGIVLILPSCSQQPNYTNWDSYLGGKDTNQYSPLTQISTSNVHQLKPAWTYQCGDVDPDNRSQIQCNPLIIDGVLYGTSPKIKLIALEAATGKELWTFDPFKKDTVEGGRGVNRGVAYWADGEEKRILFTASYYLYAIDATTGKPILSFGKNGKVDLHEGLGRTVTDLFISSNTPGIIYQDLLILGSRVSESIGHVPGHVRAYNVRTGEVDWIFHTIPHPGEMGYNTWPKDAWQHSGGANVWAGMSLDERRGIVFIPTGSASFDFYGGDRIGENLFANCMLALDAKTGKRIWHYQTVHHDLWDRDLPAPPNLVRVQHKGSAVDAVAQITKSGHVFLLDREKGEPLFPIEEQPVRNSTLEGEQAWPTQPVPLKPPPFSRQQIAETDLPKRSSEAYDYAHEVWLKAGGPKPFTPMSEKPNILFPGFDGGGEWGGAAVDEKGIMYVNSSEMPWLVQMEKYEPTQSELMSDIGKQTYQTACVSCHASDLKGTDSYANIPSLVNLKDRLRKVEFTNVIIKGKGVMPSFATLSQDEINGLSAFLLETKEVALSKDLKPTWNYPYTFKGYNRFLAPDGLPAINPPFGQLTAIDLNEGIIKWQVPLGSYPELEAQGMKNTGTENYGGPVVTAGGLVFIAATVDEKIRAFDKKTGALLWEAKLPAAGFATPSVYAVDGKQYLVVAAGGGKIGQKSRDAYVAFSL